jgi:hypothetical protein
MRRLIFGFSVVLVGCSSEIINPDPSGAGAAGPTSAHAASNGATQGAGSGGGSAASTGGTGGSSSVKTVSADADPMQYVDGAIALGQKTVASGPFYLTDVSAQGGGGNSVVLFTVSGSDCSNGSKTMVVNLPAGGGFTPNLHGARVFVRAGKTLCSDSNNSNAFYFSGFRPYDG